MNTWLIRNVKRGDRVRSRSNHEREGTVRNTEIDFPSGDLDVLVLWDDRPYAAGWTYADQLEVVA